MAGDNNRRKGEVKMAKSKHAFDKFRPNHLGTQPRASNSNNGKKMNTKGNQQPDYVPPKG